MKTLKDSIIKYSIRSMLISLFLMFLGVIIIIKADVILFWVIKAIGAVLMFDALIRFINFLRTDPEDRAFSFDIIRAVIEGVIAVVALVNASSVVTLLYVFTGIIVVSEGIMHLQFVLSKRNVLNHWMPNFIISVINVILGVFIIAHPITTASYVNVFIGVELLIASFFSFAGYLYFLFTPKRDISDFIDTDSVDVE